VCRNCRRTVEVDSTAVERWTRRVAEENGFADVDHVLEVFGTCRDCART
jgi:Fur family ferric uptake transcriptional regulator